MVSGARESPGFMTPAKLYKTICFRGILEIGKSGKKRNNAGAAFSKPPAILSYG